MDRLERHADFTGSTPARFSRRAATTAAGLGMAILIASLSLVPAQAKAVEEQAMQRAVVKIIGGLFATKAIHDQDVNDFVKLGLILARNKVVSSALEDVFPDLTENQNSAVTGIICLLFDGKLNLPNVAAQQVKMFLMQKLKASAPNLANAAQIADLIYQVKQTQD